MLFSFRQKFPQLDIYWERYLQFQTRKDLPAKAVLLDEGKIAEHYIFIETGCVRAFFNNNGEDKTVQFFFENEGLTSLDSFVNNAPSLFTIETLEPSVIYLLPKKYIRQLFTELSQEREFAEIILFISAQRQMHYMNEFVSFIRDTAEERYRNLLRERPHILRRVPQRYVASYLGISSVHLSRIKRKVAIGSPQF